MQPRPTTTETGEDLASPRPGAGYALAMALISALEESGQYMVELPLPLPPRIRARTRRPSRRR
ncbi:hypothetical protein [Arenibaculum pallidiluteum]|uniref:hypothetical protein n=1 Tax=Arenibaculum pallidiluteum TaxID=2812559 RepID=UPI001A9702FC|nr:hypothetical protein [Arenibaculum pallidiluteum]